MAKRRKVKIGRVLILLLLIILIIFSLIILINILNNNLNKKEFNANDLHINELDYSLSRELDLDLYSQDYELIRLNDFKVLYASNNNKQIYPASLTKVLTMSALFNITDNLQDTTSYSAAQREELIEENASLAGLKADKSYSLKEVLYGLILPSGADAAICLENYANAKGYNLVDEMNKKIKELGLKNSNFTNTTGLHDNNLYTTLDDYALIVIDALKSDEQKKYLKTTYYEDLDFYSSLYPLLDRDDDIVIYGGKTGYTPQAGMNIMVLYEVNNRSYLLILAGAPGSPYEQAKHIEDVNKILDYLYYN